MTDRRLVGTVLEVHNERFGGEVAVGAIVGDTTISLDDVGDFNDDGGQVVGSTSIVSTYTGRDIDLGLVTGISAMGAPTAAGYSLGDWAAPYDDDTAQEFVERVATVDCGDGEPVEATVPDALRELLIRGPRTPGRGEVVELEITRGEVRIVAVRSLGDSSFLESIDLVVRDNAPAAPPAGRIRVYAVIDGTGFPQVKAKNSAGSTLPMTRTDFVDGA